jgi:hypothetical protein
MGQMLVLLKDKALGEILTDEEALRFQQKICTEESIDEIIHDLEIPSHEQHLDNCIQKNGKSPQKPASLSRTCIQRELNYIRLNSIVMKN